MKSCAGAVAGRTVDPMFAIDAGSARDVLAVVLCPARAFTGEADALADGPEAVRILKSVKSALIRRFKACVRRRERN
jgi:hypothetical protein